MLVLYDVETAMMHLPFHTHTHIDMLILNALVRVMNIKKVAHSSEYNDSDISFMLTLSLLTPQSTPNTHIKFIFFGIFLCLNKKFCTKVLKFDVI